MLINWYSHLLTRRNSDAISSITAQLSQSGTSTSWSSQFLDNSSHIVNQIPTGIRIWWAVYQYLGIRVEYIQISSRRYVSSSSSFFVIHPFLPIVAKELCLEGLDRGIEGLEEEGRFGTWDGKVKNIQSSLSYNPPPCPHLSICCSISLSLPHVSLSLIFLPRHPKEWVWG